MIVDGISLGRVKHLYSGTEYYIEELCIKTEMQGIGIGSKFIEMIEKYLVKHNIHRIFLQTEKGMPAYDFYRKMDYNELIEHVSFVKNFSILKIAKRSIKSAMQPVVYI